MRTHNRRDAMLDAVIALAPGGRSFVLRRWDVRHAPRVSRREGPHHRRPPARRADCSRSRRLVDARERVQATKAKKSRRSGEAAARGRSNSTTRIADRSGRSLSGRDQLPAGEGQFGLQNDLLHMSRHSPEPVLLLEVEGIDALVPEGELDPLNIAAMVSASAVGPAAPSSRVGHPVGSPWPGQITQRLRTEPVIVWNGR